MPMGAPPEPVDLPFPSLRKLPNGLNIAVFPDAAVPAVTITLNFSVGAKDDPPDQGGLVDVMANTLRRGTAKWTGQELAERIDARAISLWQQVNHDALTLGVWSLSDHVALAAKTLAEIARTPTFPEREVAGYVARAAAQAAIDEENPSVIASRALDQALFGQHFRARPAGGTSVSLKTITAEAIKAYHDRLIKPDVATLIFAGDITATQAFEIATECFGDWQGTAEPSVAKAPPVPIPTRILLIDRPGAVQSEIRIGQRVDLNRTQRDYPAGRLLSQVFGESFSGRLNRSLRIKKGLTYGARGYYDVDVGTAALTIRTFTRNDKVVEAIQAALAEVNRLSGSDITKSELAMAQDAIIGGFQLGLETPAQVAERYWDLMVWGLPEIWYTSYLRSIREVTDPEALHEVARRTIHPETLMIVVVGDAEKIEADLRSVAPVERLPAR
jgi:predicted Zn-dependent peptidase